MGLDGSATRLNRVKLEKMENARKGKGIYLRLKWGLLILIGDHCYFYWIILFNERGIKSIKNIIYWSQIERLHLWKSNKWKSSESSQWFSSSKEYPIEINPSFSDPNNRGQQQCRNHPFLERKPPPNRLFHIRQKIGDSIILQYHRLQCIQAILYPFSIDINSYTF